MKTTLKIIFAIIIVCSTILFIYTILKDKDIEPIIKDTPTVMEATIIGESETEYYYSPAVKYK